MTDWPRPPAHVAPYVAILGPEGAIAFLLAYGGAPLYLRRGTPDPRLVAVVGEAGARALGAAADRLPRRVPTAKPWLARALDAQGLPVAEIARRLHASDVSVRAWLRGGPRRPPPDPRQLPLL